MLNPRNFQTQSIVAQQGPYVVPCNIKPTSTVKTTVKKVDAPSNYTPRLRYLDHKPAQKPGYQTHSEHRWQTVRRSRAPQKHHMVFTRQGQELNRSLKSAPANMRDQPRCFNCSETGHLVANCRYIKKVQCYACAGWGHKTKNCGYHANSSNGLM